MLKWLFYIVFSLALSQSLIAQKNFKSTSSIAVSGDIKFPVKIELLDLFKYPVHDIGNLTIYNHLGEEKSVQKRLKGVLLKDLISTVEFNTPSPRQLSEFYFTMIASDGYKVVYSWNEIFNSPTGDHLFLIVEKDSKKINELEDQLLLVTTTDFKTGRRFVKNLSQILISRVK